MPITLEQLKARQHSIGSSDVAALIGIHPHLSEADIWATKVFPLEPDKESDWFESGNVLEPGIIDWATEQISSDLGEPIFVDKNPPTYSKEPFFHANPDGVIKQRPWLIEAKTGGSEGWGEPGTDQIPPHVLAQVQWQMFVCDADRVYVAAALASDWGIRMRMYVVDRDNEVISGLRSRATDWWRRHVLEHSRPGDSPPKLQILKRIQRTPGSMVHVDPLVIGAWDEASKALSQAKKHEARCKAALIELMGEAELTRSEELEVTYMTQSRKETVMPASTFRVLRKKKRKPKESEGE